MVTPLTKEFDFEIANTYFVFQEKTVIGFIGVIIIIQLWIITVYLMTKPKFIYFSGNRLLFLS